MGLIRKKNMEEYWSKKHPSQAAMFFAFVEREIHHDATISPCRGIGRSCLWTARTSMRYFLAPQHISIDESMVGMKNRIVQLQYMANKHHSRFGIKKFELCESVAGYVLHVAFYADNDFPIHSDMRQGHGVVMDLMRQCNMLNKGYQLFTDNFYTKPALAEVLLKAGTLWTGTVRAHSKGLPPVP